MAIPHRRRPPSGTGFTPCRFSKRDDGSRRYRAKTIEQAARRTANRALSSLNSMEGSRRSLGGPPPAAACNSDTAVMQSWVRARALEAGRLAEREAKSPCLDRPRSDEEALRQLLRGRGSYDIGSVTAGIADNLAPCNELQVALPN